MITCENVCKTYEGTSPVKALKNIQLTIDSNSFTAILGASGSGKSTLMNLIGLIDFPTSGQIQIDNVDTANLTANELAELRNRKIGYVFQAFYLEEAYTVEKNVEMPLLIAGLPSKAREERISQCLENVGMSAKQKSLVSELSGGEKQRVCIARAIANHPPILLADEPCGNLDSANRQDIMKLFQKLHNEGTTIVLITHNPEEASYADRIVVLKDGEICSNEETKLF